jgi:DNA repair exonuclease SbcCD nuclease subunit
MDAEMTATVQMVHTRPRGAAANTSKLSGPGDSSPQHDPYGETFVQRAIHRRAPTPIGIVVTGDNHLSAALPRLGAARRGERRERLRRGFAAAVDYALQHGARLFVMAGDLFDTPTPSNADRAFVAAELARLRRANIACVGVSGSHDSPRTASSASATSTAAEHGGEAPYHTYAALEGMTYFPPSATLTPRLVTLGNLRLAVAGISTSPMAPRDGDPLAGITLTDPEGALRHADLGLLIVHAGIEGFAQPADEEQIVSRASLEALPALFRVVVAGHVHRFGRARVGEREVIVPGSTERMDFDSQPGSSGFAWLEVTSDGLTGVRRIAVAEQPRADIELTTERLFPGGIPAAELGREIAGVTANSADAAALTSLLAVRNGQPGGAPTPGEQGANGWHGDGDDRDLRGLAAEHELGERDADELLAAMKQALDEVCTDETLVQLRLVGPIGREQFHRLPLREIQHYGAQRAFAFDLETNGLQVTEPPAASASSSSASSSASSGVQRAAVPTGPLSPAVEVERLLHDRLARVPASDVTAVADLHAAASILLARLRASSDREAEQ